MRLFLAHPCLPLGVGVDVGSVVVEEIALNIGLAWLVEKIKFIRPEIRVVAFHVGIVARMARLGGFKRQEISAKGAFIGRAIGPKSATRFPILAEACVVRDRVLDNESLRPFWVCQYRCETPRDRRSPAYKARSARVRALR